MLRFGGNNILYYGISQAPSTETVPEIIKTEEPVETESIQVERNEEDGEKVFNRSLIKMYKSIY